MDRSCEGCRSLVWLDPGMQWNKHWRYRWILHLGFQNIPSNIYWLDVVRTRNSRTWTPDCHPDGGEGGRKAASRVPIRKSKILNRMNFSMLSQWWNIEKKRGSPAEKSVISAERIVCPLGLLTVRVNLSCLYDLSKWKDSSTKGPLWEAKKPKNNATEK